MLDERIHQLEEKVVTLINELKRLRRENGARSAEIAELRPKAEQLGRAEEENAGLKGRVQTLEDRVRELESQTSATSAKEEEIRERLRGIIEKIDALESMPEE